MITQRRFTIHVAVVTNVTDSSFHNVITIGDALQNTLYGAAATILAESSIFGAVSNGSVPRKSSTRPPMQENCLEKIYANCNY